MGARGRAGSRKLATSAQPPARLCRKARIAASFRRDPRWQSARPAGGGIDHQAGPVQLQRSLPPDP